ncbi:MAG TPA: sporulation protein YqfD [Firmicutes bacterium]|jgi:similar to stage IV sporulation protein|nr:sporulation protein YqfD [Bacillota bacterium]HBE06924.1 sporulation protein YqfD [Bacillota bacterium]HBG45175.1 sporulation protein YqfD [Bacillota bacterium]HBL49474.1 sporulation protein YqfD [Bacillota bacterium]HBL67849.1 sporulation protein YqfD [Bacillota bacterium]
MLIQRIWFFLRGYLVILVKGPHPEQFLNAAIGQGVRLWDIQRFGPDWLLCKVGAQGFKKLRPVFRKTRCQGRIKQRIGLTFGLRRITKRPVLFLGIVVCLAVGYILSGFVWFVEVEGLQQIEPDSFRTTLEGVGVRAGARREDLDRQAIENELLKQETLIAWVSLKVKGTVAVVQVVEKELPETIPQGVVNIIAAKDGLIQKILVLKGYAAVTEGDTVHKGDLLISANPPALFGGSNSSAYSGTLGIQAQGLVEARVWYESSETVPIVSTTWQPTGKKRTLWSFRIGNHQFNLGKKPNYAKSKTSRLVKEWLPCRNGKSFVEVIRNRYFEVVGTAVTRTKSEAAQVAATKAWQEIEKSITAKEGIRELARSQLISEEAQGAVTVTAILEAIEDIGVSAGTE